MAESGTIGLLAGADRGAGRGAALAADRDRVLRGIASGVVDAIHGRRRAAPAAAEAPLRCRRARWWCRTGRRAARGADPDLVQDCRVLPILRRHLHHHVILVERVVDGRNRALAECVVERVVDLACVEPSREAVARSIVRSVARPACCWSEFTSVRVGSCCNAAKSFGAQAKTSAVLSPCSVYW